MPISFDGFFRDVTCATCVRCASWLTRYKLFYIRMKIPDWTAKWAKQLFWTGPGEEIYEMVALYTAKRDGTEGEKKN